MSVWRRYSRTTRNGASSGDLAAHPAAPAKQCSRWSGIAAAISSLIFDSTRKTLRFPVVLPEVAPASSMYADFQEFVKARFSADLPDHRRIDERKAVIRSANRKGNVSLSLTVLDTDFEYGVRKLVNLVHEVFLDFLLDGRYYDYLVETFDLDPDHL